MKKLYVLALALMAFGCQDDDAIYIPSYTPTTQPFDGAWQLRNVSGGIAGTYDDFEPGEITWTFDDETQTVTVFNNNPDTGEVDFFDSGVYDYEIVINPATPEICGFNLSIDGTNLGCFTVTDDEFKLSMVETDGHELTLKRPAAGPF
ncbi:hypothetical protein [Flavobacterium caeni]|uniref:Lipocalin-like domain-containing protein n=1 Tax=Flavobacterium caeni TaxID=490189 RepID=A0A1G5K8F6_9FLAO|nr:hypothetical protein [Flavobacterium caeni]SCY96942.1 hypothetical protein SAMN02927903_03166 [Flavobacterium caeni]